MKKIKEKPAHKVWEDFQKTENVSDEQLAKFKQYADALMSWNNEMNLTAITNLSGICRQHFSDSLVLQNFVDLQQVKTMADIGTGAGFPAIPLKIMFPHLKMVLIEVNKKRQKFLNFVISELGLQDMMIIDLDWRTFLRKTDLEIDYFVTRAALGDMELCRMFRPACAYRDAKIIYWATSEWQSHKKNESFIKENKTYRLGKRDRKLVFMGA